MKNLNLAKKIEGFARAAGLIVDVRGLEGKVGQNYMNKFQDNVVTQYLASSSGSQPRLAELVKPLQRMIEVAEEMPEALKGATGAPCQQATAQIQDAVEDRDGDYLMLLTLWVRVPLSICQPLPQDGKLPPNTELSVKDVDRQKAPQQPTGETHDQLQIPVDTSNITLSSPAARQIRTVNVEEVPMMSRMPSIIDPYQGLCDQPNAAHPSAHPTPKNMKNTYWYYQDTGEASLDGIAMRQEESSSEDQVPQPVAEIGVIQEVDVQMTPGQKHLQPYVDGSRVLVVGMPAHSTGRTVAVQCLGVQTKGSSGRRYPLGDKVKMISIQPDASTAGRYWRILLSSAKVAMMTFNI